MDRRARGLTPGVLWTAPWAGAALLLAWVVSVAGATGWSPTVNWVLLGAGVGVLAARAFVEALRARA